MVLAAAIAGALSMLKSPQDPGAAARAEPPGPVHASLSLEGKPAARFDDDLLPAFEGRARVFLEQEDPERNNALNYLVPIVEIVGFEVLLNLFDRNFVDADIYGVTADSVRGNLHHAWVLDTDPFRVNMLTHPYSGALNYGFARSAGHTPEVSFLYAAFGSVLWEYAGETGPPSLNDLIMTGLGGSFLGEALFRMANLLLRSGGEDPGLLRQAGAGLLLPSATVNGYGNRYARRFENNDPPIFLRMSLGVSQVVQESNTDKAQSHELPEDVWDRVIAINLRGPWICSKYAAPLLKEAGGGVIVNAASIGGLVGYPMGGAYGPSKAGIIQLTRVMAIELAPQGTRVVCYAPGNTETPMVEKYYSDPSLSAEEVRMVQQQLLGTHLIPRLARPEEVADLVVFLASDQAAMITGTCVVIDGGTTAWRGIRPD